MGWIPSSGRENSQGKAVVVRDRTYLWLITSHFLGCRRCFSAYVGLWVCLRRWECTLDKLSVLPPERPDSGRTGGGFICCSVSHSEPGIRKAPPSPRPLPGGLNVFGCHGAHGGDGLCPATCPWTHRRLPPSEHGVSHKLLISHHGFGAAEKAAGDTRHFPGGSVS